VFHKASIRTKLSAALGVALGLVIAVGLFGLYQLHAVNRVTAELREVRFPQIERLELIKRLTAEHKLLATRRTQTTNFHYLAAVASGMEETEKALLAAEQSYLELADKPEQIRLFAEFRELWRSYQSTLANVVQRLDAGELSAAAREFASAGLAAFEGAAAMLDHLILLSKDESGAAAQRAHDVYSLAIVLTLAAILIAAACAAGAIVWVSKKISSPILRVSEAMRRLTGGDDSAEAPSEANREDEIGVLIEAVSGYRDALLRSRRYAAAAERERERLQAAVNNLPIGLGMFDSAERVIICNSAYGEMYRLPKEMTEPGMLLTDMIRQRRETRALPREHAERFHEDVRTSVAGKQRVLKVLELQDGRTISVILQPLATGGWVAVHEDITDRRQAEERIKYMARHDAVTGLPNRVLFKEKITEALKHVPRGNKVAVLCLDLDRFKGVNDTLGHPVGDLLLKAVAERLQSSVRDTDALARFGGDEFAIAQVEQDQPQAATALARRVIDCISMPYEIEGHQLVIGVSIGIAIAPNDGDEPDILLKNGDMALYRAKNDGRGTFRFFEPDMDARMQVRRRLELDLRRGLQHEEFELFYQPVLDLKCNQVSSFEALLRWRHPERGLVSPVEFVPVAEEIGLITPLGEWVLRKACQDAVCWPDDIKVSVNLSPVQFRNSRLLQAVMTALALSKLAPQRLELEITEGVLLVETESTLALLHQLRALGVKIAMDDFGTGYSSLSYLRRFPFDRIKIDGSFIRNISHDDSSLAIVRAVTGLSTSLGMSTTAEGVETKEQLARVRAEGCNEIQGFLFSKPVPAGEIAALLPMVCDKARVAA
jgi:diguanylate cyclase (GGDEF)-like protein